MKQIATFEKVSLNQYIKDRLSTIDLEKEELPMTDFLLLATKEWEALELPKRGTSLSAGYDFHIPYEIAIGANSVLIPTGVRCRIDEGWALFLYPRSGLGTKFGMALENTTGIVDADYYFAANEGHIMAKLYTRNKIASLKQGDRFIQGVFLPIGLATNGNTEKERTGGFGSTGTK